QQKPSEYLRYPAAHELAGVLDAGGVELIEQMWLFAARRAERFRSVLLALVGADDRLFTDSHVRHEAVADCLLELAVGDRLAVGGEQPGLDERQQQQRAEHVPNARSPWCAEHAAFDGTLVSRVHARRRSKVAHMWPMR